MVYKTTPCSKTIYNYCNTQILDDNIILIISIIILLLYFETFEPMNYITLILIIIN